MNATLHDRMYVLPQPDALAVPGLRVAIYGAGANGLAVLARLRTAGVQVAMLLDDFKPETPLEGVPVRRPDALPADELAGLDIVLGTIHVPEILPRLVRARRIHLIDLPVDPMHLLVSRERADCDAAAAAIVARLHDPADRALYGELYRLRWGEPHRLLEHYARRVGTGLQYFDGVRTGSVRCALDGGVFDGYTSVMMLERFPALECILGFDILGDFLAASQCRPRLEASGRFTFTACGLFDSERELRIRKDPGHGSASKVEAGGGDGLVTVRATTIDAQRERHGRPIDFIKFDLEGSEQPALRGAASTIRRDRPQLAISIYHTPSDFLDIPLALMRDLPGYRFHLGHYSTGYSETVLYAIPEEAG